MQKINFNFHPVTMNDYEWINECQKQENIMACDLLFTSLFAWQDRNEGMVAKIKQCEVVRFKIQKEYVYSFPIGNGDKKAVLDMLFENIHAKRKQIRLAPLSEEQKNKIIEWYPGKFRFEAPRYCFDYIYRTQDLIELKGKKYQGKRNHIHRFMDEKDWEYESIDKENIQECLDFLKLWSRQKKQRGVRSKKELKQENKALKRVFANYEKLNLRGGILRKNKKCVAFTIAERQNADTMDIHFEKADVKAAGAYAMIQWQFLQHEGADYVLVNREDDEGDEGLRKAKLSYHPYALIPKYVAYEELENRKVK